MGHDHYEQGLRRMGIEEARELAAALGTVSAAYLLCLDDEQNLTDREHKLLACFRKADERGKETIMRLAEIAAPERGAARSDA